jgi:hypothetical protein
MHLLSQAVHVVQLVRHVRQLSLPSLYLPSGQVTDKAEQVVPLRYQKGGHWHCPKLVDWNSGAMFQVELNPVAFFI